MVSWIKLVCVFRSGHSLSNDIWYVFIGWVVPKISSKQNGMHVFDDLSWGAWGLMAILHWFAAFSRYFVGATSGKKVKAWLNGVFVSWKIWIKILQYVSQYSLGILQYIAIYKFPQYPALMRNMSILPRNQPRHANLLPFRTYQLLSTCALHQVSFSLNKSCILGFFHTFSGIFGVVPTSSYMHTSILHMFYHMPQYVMLMSYHARYDLMTDLISMKKPQYEDDENSHIGKNSILSCPQE